MDGQITGKQLLQNPLIASIFGGALKGQPQPNSANPQAQPTQPPAQGQPPTPQASQQGMTIPQQMPPQQSDPELKIALEALASHVKHKHAVEKAKMGIK